MSTWRALFERILALASRQHGCVTRAQLLELGAAPGTIAKWVTGGRLFAVHRGVYAVGRPLATPLEYAAAAVLACGPDAALSHHSALALWGLGRRWPPTVQVTTPTQRTRPGIRVHRARRLTACDLRVHQRIQVTSPARTVLDCAPRLSEAALARVIADGRRSGQLRPAALDDVLRRFVNHPGRAGILALRDDTLAPTRSRFEDLFLTFCADHGLPRPQVNVHVAGREVDAYFAAERLIVELDGWDFHRDRAQFEADRDHDAQALALDLATYRLTWSRLVRTPAREAERLRRVLAGRR